MKNLTYFYIKKHIKRTWFIFKRTGFRGHETRYLLNKMTKVFLKGFINSIMEMIKKR